MIRLEIQISTFSLVAFSATFFPLVTSGLAFYLAACELRPTPSVENSAKNVKVSVASAVTGVFLLLTALVQIWTGLMLVPLKRRALLLTLHAFPLLGAVVAGIVWFGSQLSGESMAKQYLEAELAALVLWFVSTVSSTMAATYFIVQAQLMFYGDIDRENVDKCYYINKSADKAFFPEPLTSQLGEKQAYFASQTLNTSIGAGKNYGTMKPPDRNRFSTALTLKNESVDLTIPPSPETKTVQPNVPQIKLMTPLYGSPLNQSRPTIMVETTDSTSANSTSMSERNDSKYNCFDTIRPSLRLHHQRDSVMDSFYSQKNSMCDDAGIRESLVAPLVICKQRAMPKGSIKKLITSGARSFSNGTRRISTKLLSQSSSPIKEVPKSWKIKKQGLPRLKVQTKFSEPSTTIHQQEQPQQGHEFDDWDVNSTRLKDRLLISSLSNFDIKTAYTGSRPVSRLSAIATTGGGVPRTSSHSSSLNEAGFMSSFTPQISPLNECNDKLVDLSYISDKDISDNDSVDSKNRTSSYLRSHFKEPLALSSNSGTRLIHKIYSPVSANIAANEIVPTPVSTRSAFSFADSVLFVNGTRQELDSLSQYDKERLTHAKILVE